MKKQKRVFENRLFRFWRDQKRMTLEEVGKAVGAAKQTVQKWESGEAIPRDPKIYAIARLFDISVYDISNLPPEPEFNKKSELFDKALNDPMFEIVVKFWNELTAGDKGEVIEYMQKKAEKHVNSLQQEKE